MSILLFISLITALFLANVGGTRGTPTPVLISSQQQVQSAAAATPTPVAPVTTFAQTNPANSILCSLMPRVVVAEPSDVMRYLLEYIVTRMLGWECNSATTGHQAWELVQKLQPDLVIAEGHIRDLDGLELVRRMQSHPPPRFYSRRVDRCAGRRG